MAEKILESSALSAFCGGMATMVSAGIQTEEAAMLLSQNREDSRFHEVCVALYGSLTAGKPLAEAMEATEGFPAYATQMVRIGESSGHVENVLRNLETYYAEEDRMFAKMKSAVGRPAALLAIMLVILAFTVFVILPVFRNTYNSMAGALAAGSAGAVRASSIIGWVALVLTLVLVVGAVVLLVMIRTQHGRERVISLLRPLPVVGRALRQLSLSRFMAALATFVSAGVPDDEAMRRAVETVDHPELRAQLQTAADSMASIDNPLNITQALEECQVLEPLYQRLLEVGSRSGSTEETMSALSATFFDDAMVEIDHAMDLIEPVFALFLTVVIGVTLIAVMLPLIGIMGAIG